MTDSETLTVAALQCALGGDVATNVARVEELVRDAAGKGAKLVLPPELFEGPYFCREEKDTFFETARPVAGHPTIERFQALAKELSIVLPVSFFERAGQAYYNSLAMVDADGALLGVYRKSHIPDGPGYEEKFYFRQGDTGFRVFGTREGPVGAAVCWDQWFPECARALVLSGADVLLYPTAIGSEPNNPSLDTRDMWQRAMLGHAVCNIVPVVAANRVGNEGGQVFYGSSFVANHRGEKLVELSREEEGAAIATLDLAAARRERASWGFFRDRRPDLYRVLTTADGSA
jgi:N-carbamoylputrescine amidase